MSVHLPEIPVLELSGGPADVGAAHGEAERKRIGQYADRFIGWLIRSASVSLTEESLWAKWAPQVAVNERLAPNLIQEMRSIARGSGVVMDRHIHSDHRGPQLRSALPRQPVGNVVGQRRHLQGILANQQVLPSMQCSLDWWH